MAYGAFEHGETNGKTSGWSGGGFAVVPRRSTRSPDMEAFLISLSTVAIAEMGDRTQLLALVLAAHYRKPWPIIAGVVCATLVNHAVAGYVGAHLGRFLTPSRLDLVVGISMIGMALWALKPDKLDDSDAKPRRASAFVATCIAFFIAEIGDKTQIATMALGAAYSSLAAVVSGTTLGMIAANAPVVFLGNAFSKRLPLKAIHIVASLLFLGLGALFIWRALAHGV
jgi:putative Ca2+/H+ antiporter (TMEM165/GDT1 family)